MSPNDEKPSVSQMPWPSEPSAALQSQPGQEQKAGFQGANPIVANSMPPANLAALPPRPRPTVEVAHHTAASANDTETDDALWVGRVKDIVAQTQSDPYARMQALQQLRSLYQKERFGRVAEKEDRS